MVHANPPIVCGQRFFIKAAVYWVRSSSGASEKTKPARSVRVQQPQLATGALKPRRWTRSHAYRLMPEIVLLSSFPLLVWHPVATGAEGVC